MAGLEKRQTRGRGAGAVEQEQEAGSGAGETGGAGEVEEIIRMTLGLKNYLGG